MNVTAADVQSAMGELCCHSEFIKGTSMDVVVLQNGNQLPVKIQRNYNLFSVYT